MPEPAQAISTTLPQLLQEEFLADYLDSRRPMYERLSGLKDFSFHFGQQTGFDHQSDTVILGLKQLQSLSISDPYQLDFTVLHEIGHFYELSCDPEGYEKLINEGEREDDLGPAYFSFYNALLDIYVNTNTANRADIYRSISKNGSYQFATPIKDLYRNQLFQVRNMSLHPLSTQYAHYLLNLGMGVAEDIQLAPEVQTEVNKIHHYIGQSFTTSDIIEIFLRPAIGKRTTKTWQATIGQRKSVIDLMFRPSFEKLIALDIQAGRDLQEQLWSLWDHGEPPLDVLKSAVDRAKEIQKSHNLTPEELATKERNRQAQAIAEQAQLTADEAKDFSSTIERTHKTAQGIANILRRIQTPQISWITTTQQHFRKGQILDVSKVVSDYPEVERNPSKVEVMKRQLPKKQVDYQPKRLRIWIVPDLSQSMQAQEPMLKDLTVAFGVAGSTLCHESILGQHSLSASVGIVGFHQKKVPLLQPDQIVSLQDIAKIFPKIKAKGSDTCEHKALQHVKNYITKQPDQEAIDILVEVTDGETTKAGTSRKLLKQILATGAQAFAFRFQSSGSDVSKFNATWNSHGSQRGFIVPSAEANYILPHVQKALEEVVSKLK